MKISFPTVNRIEEIYVHLRVIFLPFLSTSHLRRRKGDEVREEEEEEKEINILPMSWLQLISLNSRFLDGTGKVSRGIRRRGIEDRKQRTGWEEV